MRDTAVFLDVKGNERDTQAEILAAASFFSTPAQPTTSPSSTSYESYISRATLAALTPDKNIAPKLAPILEEPSSSASSIPPVMRPGTTSRVLLTMKSSAWRCVW